MDNPTHVTTDSGKAVSTHGSNETESTINEQVSYTAVPDNLKPTKILVEDTIDHSHDMVEEYQTITNPIGPESALGYDIQNDEKLNSSNETELNETETKFLVEDTIDHSHDMVEEYQTITNPSGPESALGYDIQNDEKLNSSNETELNENENETDTKFLIKDTIDHSYDMVEEYQTITNSSGSESALGYDIQNDEKLNSSSETELNETDTKFLVEDTIDHSHDMVEEYQTITNPSGPESALGYDIQNDEKLNSSNETELKSTQSDEETNLVGEEIHLECPNVVKEAIEIDSIERERKLQALNHILKNIENALDTNTIMSVDDEENRPDTDSVATENQLGAMTSSDDKSALIKQPNSNIIEVCKEFVEQIIKEAESQIADRTHTLERHEREKRSPPVPLLTYRWEDVRRSKVLGGYPWTHLYKGPLGPDEQPAIIAKLKSTNSFDENSLKPNELKTQSLSDLEYKNNSVDFPTKSNRDRSNRDSENCLETDEPTEGKTQSLTTSEGRAARSVLKNILSGTRRFSFKKSRSEEPSEDRTTNHQLPVRRPTCCYPLVEKIKTMADKQMHKHKKPPIKRIPLKAGDEIKLQEPTKILKLKESPKADRKELASFVEKLDSEDKMEILELDESPSETRKRREQQRSEERQSESTSVLVPDEIIKLPVTVSNGDEKSINDDNDDSTEILVNQLIKEELQNLNVIQEKRQGQLKTNDYEDIADPIIRQLISDEIKWEQENPNSTEVECELNREEPVLSEQSTEKQIDRNISSSKSSLNQQGIKSLLKRDPSPAGEKKVTFSPSTEDDADMTKEDVELPDHVKVEKRWDKMSDHEYEPVGAPAETTDVIEPTPDTKVVSETQEIQDEMEKHFFSSTPVASPAPVVENISEDNDVDLDIDEAEVKKDSKFKEMLSNVQASSKEMQMKVKNKAANIRDKFKTKHPKKNESPVMKDRKKFKAPNLNKLKNIHMPKISKPDFKNMELFKSKKVDNLSDPTTESETNTETTTKSVPKSENKFSNFFRSASKPESNENPTVLDARRSSEPIQPKVNNKFSLTERVSLIRIKRSKSVKEEPTSHIKEITETVVTDETVSTDPNTTGNKKLFDINFRTFPRILSREKKEKTNLFTTTRKPPSSKVSLPGKPEGPVGARWTTKYSETSTGDNESGNYRRFETDSEDRDKESSVERRMRLDLEDYPEDDQKSLEYKTDEQIQIHDFDEENRAIHMISQAREKEFMNRKPVIRQASDLTSEESKEFNWDDKYGIDKYNLNNEEELDFRLQTPRHDDDSGNMSRTPDMQNSSTNVSGKGVIEEISDDEFYLRRRGISQDNIEISKYISEAIREGFEMPKNSLASMDENVNFGYDVPTPQKPSRNKQFSYADDEHDFHENRQDKRNDFMFTDKPKTNLETYKENLRKFYYENEMMEGIEQPDILVTNDENINFMNIQSMEPSYVPKAPKRKKKGRGKLSASSSLRDDFLDGSISSDFLANEQNDEAIVYRTEHEYIIPLAEPEMDPPSPLPRRKRLNSQTSRITVEDDRTSHGADSLILDNQVPDVPTKCKIEELKDANGYAIVKKDPPPRPPAPVRRKRSTRSNNTEEIFATLPSRKPVRNPKRFNTIGPSRPPRRKSSTSLNDAQSETLSLDGTQYEEIDDDRLDSSHLHSGEVMSKMKDRPLPPPPRPPRDKRSKFQDQNDKFDFDDGAEGIVHMHHINIDDMNASTQTDGALEFETSDGKTKTLEDILREEQEAELERAKQESDHSLSKGIQRFRESNQRSFSERSRASTDNRPRTPGSRPITPSGIVVERKISNTKTPDLTEAKLFVRPIDQDEMDFLEAERADLAQQHQKEILPSKKSATDIAFEEYKATLKIQKEASPTRDNLDMNFQNEDNIGHADDQTSPHSMNPLSTLEDIRQPYTENAEDMCDLEIPNDNNRTAPIETVESRSDNVLVNPSFLEEIVERVRNLEQSHRQLERHTRSDDEPPTRPPLPDDYTPYSEPPPEFYRLQDPDDSESVSRSHHNGTPRHHHRRHRHHKSTSSEEEYKHDRKLRSKSAEPGILDLSGQLLRACGSAAARTGSSILNRIQVLRKEHTKIDVQFIVVMLICIVFGLIMLNLRSTTVHHHHWDYFNPPSDFGGLD